MGGPCSRSMVGVVRLYLDPKEELPEPNRPESFPPVIDCLPEYARRTQRKWQRQGFDVIAVPL